MYRTSSAVRVSHGVRSMSPASSRRNSTGKITPLTLWNPQRTRMERNRPVVVTDFASAVVARGDQEPDRNHSSCGTDFTRWIAASSNFNPSSPSSFVACA